MDEHDQPIHPLSDPKSHAPGLWCSGGATAGLREERRRSRPPAPRPRLCAHSLCSHLGPRTPRAWVQGCSATTALESQLPGAPQEPGSQAGRSCIPRWCPGAAWGRWMHPKNSARAGEGWGGPPARGNRPGLQSRRAASAPPSPAGPADFGPVARQVPGRQELEQWAGPLPPQTPCSLSLPWVSQHSSKLLP